MGVGTVSGSTGTPMPQPTWSMTAGLLAGSPGVTGTPTWAEAVAVSRASARTSQVLMQNLKLFGT